MKRKIKKTLQKGTKIFFEISFFEERLRYPGASGGRKDDFRMTCVGVKKRMASFLDDPYWLKQVNAPTAVLAAFASGRQRNGRNLEGKVTAAAV